MTERWSYALLVLSLAACEAKKPTAGSQRASASAGSAAAVAADSRWPGPLVTARHPVDGVSRLVLRAGWRRDEKVTVDPAATEIVVQGRPTLWGVEGESQKPDGEFAFQRFGDTLLVTTQGEYVHLHMGVTIEDIEITVPPSVTVTREHMVENQDRAPDLRPPGAPPR